MQTFPQVKPPDTHTTNGRNHRLGGYLEISHCSEAHLSSIPIETI